MTSYVDHFKLYNLEFSYCSLCSCFLQVLPCSDLGILSLQPASRTVGFWKTYNRIKKTCLPLTASFRENDSHRKLKNVHMLIGKFFRYLKKDSFHGQLHLISNNPIHFMTYFHQAVKSRQPI